jgi:hypothetical protein
VLWAPCRNVALWIGCCTINPQVSHVRPDQLPHWNLVPQASTSMALSYHPTPTLLGTLSPLTDSTASSSPTRCSSPSLSYNPPLLSKDTVTIHVIKTNFDPSLPENIKFPIIRGDTDVSRTFTESQRHFAEKALAPRTLDEFEDKVSTRNHNYLYLIFFHYSYRTCFTREREKIPQLISDYPIIFQRGQYSGLAV